MSAKFLHGFADENPELQKQIGCMTGIFQMFDRHHFLTGRRLSGGNHKRLASGHALQNSGNTGADRSTCALQIVLEKNHSKSSNENQRASMESSRTSFSSSSCSSFSSLECNRSTQQEPSSIDRTFLERPTKNSPRLKHSDINSRPVQFGPLTDPPHASAQPDRRSLDFQDVVKDSIYRETRSLSIKTSTKEEVKNHKLKHRDSPRPMLLSKSVDGSYVIGVDEKSRLSADLNESLRVLAKLKEAPWHFKEANESPRSSHEANDTSFFPVSREAPRFSYDGREISRSSLDSRDVSKPAFNLRELPRLSLDSREGSLRSSNFGLKPHSSLKDSDTSSINQGGPTPSNFQQEWGGHKRPTSVVAKLMGLEAMPHLSLASQKPADLTETYAGKDKDPPNGQRNRNLITKASRGTQDSRKDHLLHSPKSSLKDPAMQQLKKSDPVMKPVSNSRLPIETAPWRQQERIQIPKKTTFGHQGAQLKQHPESFYSDIEKKLKELDFQQSNKDFRALKQIFDAMQAKGLLETKRSEDQHLSVCRNYSDQPPTGNDQNFRSTDARNQHNTPSVPTSMKGSNTPRAFESPIVIMKPAKSVSKSSVSASSVIPLAGLSGLRKLHTSDSMHIKKTSTYNRMVKEQNPKASTREYKKSTNRTEEISIQKNHLQMEQCLYRRQHSPRENSGSSVKTSGSLSPRLQQRKVETENRSRLPIPSSESNKPRRNSANRQSLESVSPRGRLRQRPAQAQQNDDQLSDISSGVRSLSHPGDEISPMSEINKSLAQDDIEVTSADSAEIGLRCLQQGSWSPSRRAVNSSSSVIKQKVRASQTSSCSLSEDVSAVELATVAPEQPSPISVLDASFYQDDMPPSPVSKAPSVFKGDENDPSEHRWNPKTLPDSSSPKLGSKFNHKKLENIENLVQKLRQLSSTDDEAPATDHIALLCETQSPDHRYVSEILLASGLLMKDINSGTMGPMPIQLHPSGYPINPDLFLVLEQTKSSMLTKLESIHEDTPRPKPEREKIHRKLLFDVVNELLIQKLELTSPGAQPSLMLQAKKLAGRFPSGQQLLRELCSEIEQLKADTSIHDCCNDDTNLISGQDVLRQSKGWYEFSTEVPDMVLEIERLIFKDLIDEVVSGEGASGLQTKASRWRRQLFAK